MVVVLVVAWLSPGAAWSGDAAAAILTDTARTAGKLVLAGSLVQLMATGRAV
jgi:hypothetical protein